MGLAPIGSTPPFHGARPEHSWEYLTVGSSAILSAGLPRPGVAVHVAIVTPGSRLPLVTRANNTEDNDNQHDREEEQ